MPVRHDFQTGGGQSPCDIRILNDNCVVADRDPNRNLMHPRTVFDLSLNYLVANTVRIDLGYQLNPIDTLLVDGKLQQRQWRVHFSIGQAF
jgi:hypothetical protein